MASLKGTERLSVIAKELGIPQASMKLLSREPGFPEPVAIVAGIRLYRMIEIAIYVGRIPPRF